MGKRKPPDLKAHFGQASKQEPPESSIVFHLSEHTLNLYHAPDG